jgi:hypothetical protein
VTKPGRGRATVIHFHGEASVPSMDGWAEQYFCQNETKVRQAWQLPQLAFSWQRCIRIHKLRLGTPFVSSKRLAGVFISSPLTSSAVLLQDYILPNNRHATLFYHDHSVGITSENVYAGECASSAVHSGQGHQCCLRFICPSSWIGCQ